MLSWDDIRTIQPAFLASSLSQCATMIRKSHELRKEIHDMRKPLWMGLGGIACSGRMKKVEQSLSYVNEAWEFFGKILTNLHYRLSKVCAVRDEALTRIALNGFTVDHPGRVRDMFDQGQAPQVQAVVGIDRKQMLKETQVLVDTALRQAEQAQQCAIDESKALIRGNYDAICEVGAQYPSILSIFGSSATPTSLPEHERMFGVVSMSPEKAAFWWASKTSEEQEKLLHSYPEFLGLLGGIPANIRDSANRRVLKKKIDEVERELPKARKQYQELNKKLSETPETSRDYTDIAGKWGKASALYTSLQQRRDAYLAIRYSIGFDKNWKDVTKGGPERQLVSFKDVGQAGARRPQAVVSVGNLDTAQTVGVFVPGMGTTVSGELVSHTSNAAYMHSRVEKELIRAGKRDEVAMVAWLGYDPASNVTDLTGFGDSRIREGGRDLASFLEGLDAQRKMSTGAPITNLIVAGHSQGSTVSSQAMMDVKPGIVRHYIAYGTPGMRGAGWDLNTGMEATGTSQSNHVLSIRGDIIDIPNAVNGGNLGEEYNILGYNPRVDPHFDHHTYPSQGGVSLGTPVKNHSAYVQPHHTVATNDFVDIMTRDAPPRHWRRK